MAERYFQGSFAPWFLFDLVERGTITPQEAWLWLNINSFQKGGRHCFMTNEGLGKRVGVEKRQTQNYITHLEELGLIGRREEDIDGVKRRILATTPPSNTLLPPMNLISSPPSSQLLDKEDKEKEDISTNPQKRVSSLLPIPEKAIYKPTSIRFQKVFIRAWNKCHSGEYLWKGGKDGKAIKTIFGHLKGDVARFKLIVKRYMDEDGPFYKGHPIGKLLAEWERFAARPDDGDSGGRSGNGSNGASREPEIKVTTIIGKPMSQKEWERYRTQEGLD